MRRRLAIVISVGAVAAVAAGVPGSAGAQTAGCPAGMVLIPEAAAPGSKDGMHPKDGSRDDVGGPGDSFVCAKVDPETGRVSGGPDNEGIADNQ